MKRRNLIDLLTDRPIVHPTRIGGVTWRGRQLTISVQGHRWWASPYEDRRAEGGMSLVFNGLENGRLFTDELEPDDDEALEDFEVVSVSKVPWAQACDWSIFCSGPLSEPISLYAKVHDYLRLSDAFVGPERFLNQAGDLSRFVSMAKAAGFLIGRGPICIRDLICVELERQAVPHNVVRTTADAEPQYLVRLGNSAFLCQEAVAEVPD
jgi:hypothetical protein